MALYAIGDLHLSLGADKSMEVFGEAWQGYVGKIETALSALNEDDVLVLAGADPTRLAEETAPTLEEAVAAARTLQAGGMPPSAAAKQAAAGTPFSKGQIYKELIK